MKQIMSTFLRISLLFSLMWGTGQIVFAQLPSQGEWGTYGIATYLDTNQDIKLTGDINMVGVIVVNPGVTLKITSDTPRNITNTGIVELGKGATLGRSIMFNIKPSGKLIIEGTEEAPITIDGGAAFTWDNYQLTTSSSKTLREAIYCEGILELTHVNLKDVHTKHVNNEETPGSGISILKGSNVTLKNTTISHCKAYSAESGGAMNITNAEVSLVKCIIEKCLSGSSGGGISIKGNSSTVNIANTEISQCKTSSNGGGMYISSAEQVLLNGCTIENCRSNSIGGGISIGSTQRETRLTNCQIKSCNAGSNGGGLNIANNISHTIFDGCTIESCQAQLGAAIMIAGGGKTIDPKNCEVRINDSTIKGCLSGGGNTNNSGGAIRTYGSTVSNLYLTRVTFTENHSQRNKNYQDYQDVGNGGALFWNAHGSDVDESFCYIEGCTFSNNKSDDNGGAIKSQGSIVFRNNPTTIENNEAPNGAGLYIEGYHGGADKGTKSTISYDLNEQMIVKDNTAPQNTATGTPGKGAGIHFIFGENMDLADESEITVTLSGATIQDNTAYGLGGGIYFENSTTNATYKIEINLDEGTVQGNTATDKGGGIYIQKGDVQSDTKLQIAKNLAETDGGGIYIDGGNLIVKGGEITENEAETGNGGGSYIVGGGSFTMEGGKIESNRSIAGVGGGVYINGGNFTLVGGAISNNTTELSGGGAYVIGGGSFTMNGGKIETNSATKSEGGGVFISGGGSFFMNGGEILSNQAQASNGGGAYIDNGAIIISEGSIKSNTAKLNGGGVYLNGGNLQVTNGEILNNQAEANGGGISILNGTVNMGGGSISSNTAIYGGGVYVYNTPDAEERGVSFSGGSVSQNRATYGGGVCVDGNISLTIGNVEIAENVATNGGGVCLLNNAHMSFGKGQIKNNQANKKDETLVSTGYQTDITELQGIGGGIYLNSNTALSFTEIDQLGLFGNMAELGADDIFANGQNTSVQLPIVTHMKLDGYPGAANLKWMEDYITNDTSYDKGTKKIGDAWNTSKTNKRYRIANSNNEKTYEVDGGTTFTNYVCLAIGYEVIFITVKKEGLKTGESAIFNLTNESGVNFQVIMTGVEGQTITKKIYVPVGTWTVAETGWGWTYDMVESSITKNIAEVADREFIFKNTKKSIDKLIYDEAVKVNEMGTGVSE